MMNPLRVLFRVRPRLPMDWVESDMGLKVIAVMFETGMDCVPVEPVVAVVPVMPVTPDMPVVPMAV